MDIRQATSADLQVIDMLMQAYMRESHERPWQGSIEELAEAWREGAVHLLVVGEIGRPVSFALWAPSYDARRSARGGEILDLYVSPWERGRGLAARMVATIAADVQRLGGRYLRGQAAEDPSVNRLYQRVAITHPGANIHVGGRAFRALAALSGSSPRKIIGQLPDKAWNHEP